MTTEERDAVGDEVRDEFRRITERDRARRFRRLMRWAVAVGAALLTCLMQGLATSGDGPAPDEFDEPFFTWHPGALIFGALLMAAGLIAIELWQHGRTEPSE